MNNVKKYKVTKEFKLFDVTFGHQTYTEGMEIRIIENAVSDGILKLFHIDSDFAKEHGKIVERLW